ncbi:MAG: hypothetical protein IJ863_01735 [Spirochaetales bacterium]|nr:hypothetical protein [Spirochaetales bacterium]
MKRYIAILVLVLAFVPSFVFSAQFHSVPVGHEAYRIIEVAEIRGIIPVQSDVKPYNLNTVRALLSEIRDSEAVSSSERAEIDRILDDFADLYGAEPTSQFSDVFRKGYLRASGANTTTVGAMVSTENAIGLRKAGEGTDGIIDSRNGVTAYINGDILDFLSYDLNFRVSVDRVDISADITPDFRVDCDGFYMNLADSGDRLRTLPNEDDANRFGIYEGIFSGSEMSASIKDDLVTLRIGKVRRDWGPGLNNLGLSGSANAFDGFEFSIRPVSWFNYSVMTGSLGYFSVDTVNGVEWPSENMDTKSGRYYNNMSIHRVELGPFKGAKFSIWESVVWRKRFELSYINPFCIYMFAQNSLGDYDNVLAGFDLTVTTKVGRFYAALSMDEINDTHLISHPRNILSYQIGAKIPLGMLDFSELTLQATYVPAFFGAHYASKASIFGDSEYTVAYVNKGQTMSYPVNPDTIELLANMETSFGKGWNLSCTVKDQMRSAQYSAKTTGTDILTTMSYAAADDGEYESRDFFNNIWDNILDAEMKVEKKLDSYPVTFTFGGRVIWERSRSFDPVTKDAIIDGVPFKYNPGIVNSYGDWSDSITACALLGVKLYY